MNLKTREGIMDGIKNAANIKYDVLKEGYNTAVKRIAYFMRKIEFFQNFLLEDKRALIGNDVHILGAQIIYFNEGRSLSRHKRCRF